MFEEENYSGCFPGDRNDGGFEGEVEEVSKKRSTFGPDVF